MVEKPVVEKPVEVKPVVEKPAVESPVTEPEQPAKETPKNPFISSIQGKVKELRGGDEESSSKETDDNSDEQPSEGKTPWYVRLRDKVRDAIFPETVEDDDISYR